MSCVDFRCIGDKLGTGGSCVDAKAYSATSLTGQVSGRAFFRQLDCSRATPGWCPAVNSGLRLNYISPGTSDKDLA